MKNNRLKFNDCRRVADHFRGIYGIYFKLIYKNPRIVNM